MDLLRLLEALKEKQVRFVVIGGVAMSLHGSSHVTFDLDVVYSRDEANLQRMVEALVLLKPRLRGAPEGLPFRWEADTLKLGSNFTLSTESGDLDLLGHAPGAPPFDELEANADPVSLGDLEVLVASLDDLIAMKRAAGRTKDKLHLLELERLSELGDP